MFNGLLKALYYSIAFALVSAITFTLARVIKVGVKITDDHGERIIAGHFEFGIKVFFLFLFFALIYKLVLVVIRRKK